MSTRRLLSRRPKNSSSEKKLTALNAAELVLRKFAKRKPMHCQDIAEKAMREGWLTSKATRPGAPGWQLLYRVQKDIKKREERGDSARFTNPARGYLGLAEWKHKASPSRSKKIPSVVYVASNPAMEGLLKIGITKDLEQRMDDLYKTNVPFRFDCEYAIRVDDAESTEKKLHRILKGRVNPRREFFQLDAEDIIPFLMRLGEYVTPPPNSPDAHGAKMTRTRRPLLRFSELKIRPGATLVADHPRSDEKCTVVRDGYVKFRGREMTFTNATKRLLGNPTWQPRPARHWRYKGRLLVDIYNETYSAKKRRK